jgi:hypothetical protein
LTYFKAFFADAQSLAFFLIEIFDLYLKKWFVNNTSEKALSSQLSALSRQLLKLNAECFHVNTHGLPPSIKVCTNVSRASGKVFPIPQGSLWDGNGSAVAFSYPSLALP